jgi:hypothetical protein
MMESAADFGTGLRAHLGLEPSELELLAVAAAAPEEVLAVETPPESESDEDADRPLDRGTLGALESLEAELLERERVLAAREASLAGRAGALLAAAQALYDDVLGGGPAGPDDELARLRWRKGVA